MPKIKIFSFIFYQMNVQDIKIRNDMFLTFAVITENSCQDREMSKKAALK